MAFQNFIIAWLVVYVQTHICQVTRFCTKKFPLFFRDSWSEGKWQLAIIDGELSCICWMRRRSGTTEAPGMCRPRTLRSWKECLCSSDLKRMVSIQIAPTKFPIHSYWSHNICCSPWTMNHSYQISSCLLHLRYTHAINEKSRLCIANCSKWVFNLVNFEV